jgi:hypothetical protein
LEDARSALVEEINSDSDALRMNHADTLRRGPGSDPADRAASARWLRNDIQLLDQLLDASSDTKLTAERDALTEMLQEMVRLLAARLGEQANYAPVPMGAVLEITGRLRWAAEEAIRIDPALDERKVP